MLTANVGLHVLAESNSVNKKKGRGNVTPACKPNPFLPTHQRLTQDHN